MEAVIRHAMAEIAVRVPQLMVYKASALRTEFVLGMLVRFLRR